jgi:hypothetical protein
MRTWLATAALRGVVSRIGAVAALLTSAPQLLWPHPRAKPAAKPR